MPVQQIPVQMPDVEQMPVQQMPVQQCNTSANAPRRKHRRTTGLSTVVVHQVCAMSCSHHAPGVFGDPSTRTAGQKRQFALHLNHVRWSAECKQRAANKIKVPVQSTAMLPGSSCNVLQVYEHGRTQGQLNIIRKSANIIRSGFLPGGLQGLATLIDAPRHTVKMNAAFMALIWIRRQLHVLKLYLANETRLCGFCDRLEFDAAKQTLVVDTCKDLLWHQQKAAWPVMSSVCSFSWWKGSTAYYLDMARVPVLLVGSRNGACIYNALFQQTAYPGLISFGLCPASPPEFDSRKTVV